MRVLIVNPHTSFYGGAERVVVKLANYLTKKGIENALVTLTMIPEVRRDLHGTRIIVPEKGYSLKVRSSGVASALGLVKEIARMWKGVHDNINSFDVINVHNFPANWCTFPYRKPVVWMCNEPPELWQNVNPSLPLKIVFGTAMKIDGFMVRNYMDTICVADEFNAQRIKQKYGRESVITPYGVDCEFFSAGNGKRSREKLGLENEFLMAQVSIVIRSKNQLKSIKTLEGIKKKIPDAKLVLSGTAEGEYADMLRSYVREHGLGKNVIFTGHMPSEDIRDLYAASNAVLFPIKAQGGWLSLFESLCAAKPIVVSPEMTASAIIKQNDLGVVTDDFVEAVEEIYQNPVKHAQKAKKGREWVKQNLSWEKFCQKLVNEFEAAMEKKK